MEDQDNNHSTANNDEIDVSGTSAEKHSRTPDYDASSASIKREEDSSQFSQSGSRLGTSSQAVDVVEISSDDELQVIEASKEQSVQKALGDKNADGQTRNSSSGRTSPKDVTCSVCLSEFDNKAFLDKCFHAFCYFCILQWSEIVRTCPLCKSSFTSIIHSVKSMDNYQQHFLSKPDVYAPTIQHQAHSDGRRFRYRTTLSEGRHPQQQGQRRQRDVSDAWGQQAQRRQAHLSLQRNRGAIARERRRTVYSNNLWVQGVTQPGRPRRREISPEFFRANPACTHRLIPWLTRDLRVLLNDEESHVNFVLQIILSLITKVELCSDEFCNHLRSFLFDKTEHFIHEFMSFARSPFDVNAYDERAQYSWPDESREQVRDTPTVFHGHTAGWQTPVPVPGTSGVSPLELSETDWGRDSPVHRGEVTSWSPSSSPGPTGRSWPRFSRTVTISSSSSIQTVSIEHSGSDEGNSPSYLKDKGKRCESERETTANSKTPVESRKKHSQPHRRHSHKHKRKHKHKHQRKDSSTHSKSGHYNSSERDLHMPGTSRHVSVDSSVSENSVDIIVVSDSTASPDLPRVHSKSGSVNLASCHGNKRTLLSRSRSRSSSVVKGKRSSQRKHRHQSRSRSREKRERSMCSKNSSRSSSGHKESRDFSGLRGERKFKVRCVSSSRDSVSHSQTTERPQSRSHSKNSDSRFHERHHSKRERRLYDGSQDLSNAESRFSVFNKEKDKREKSRSRSHSRSHSRSKGKTRLKNFERTKSHRNSRSRSTSPLVTRHKAASSSYSRDLRSRSRSRSQLRSQSRSRPQSRSRSRSRSRCQSSSMSRNKSPQLSVPSASKSNEFISHSNEDVKTEIEDLELRITADKKRLLQLLIKQERTKRDGISGISKETGSAPREADGDKL